MKIIIIIISITFHQNLVLLTSNAAGVVYFQIDVLNSCYEEIHCKCKDFDERDFFDEDGYLCTDRCYKYVIYW